MFRLFATLNHEMFKQPVSAGQGVDFDFNWGSGLMSSNFMNIQYFERSQQMAT